MTDREQILASIRRNLGREAPDAARRAELVARVAARGEGPVPARGQVPRDAQVDLFQQMAGGADATVARLAAPAEIPEEVRRYAHDLGLPSELLLAPNTDLGQMDWRSHGITTRQAPPQKREALAMTQAFAGVAETGTLMMLSSPATPNLLNFLPDNLIVVLDTRRIVGSYEQGWSLIRQETDALPRTVVWVTGPSRTGDIEQTLQLGAHGTLRLHILLV